MEFQGDNNFSGPTPPPEPIPGLSEKPIMQPRKKGSGWRILLGIMFALSVIANFLLIFMLIGALIIITSGQRSTFTEEVIREGPMGTKIAVVTIDGVIYGEQADSVYRQLEAAKKDRHVKAVIVRVSSPGGTISASDQIYEEIRKFRDNTNKPVIAFMQGVAASGGYYTSAQGKNTGRASF